MGALLPTQLRKESGLQGQASTSLGMKKQLGKGSPYKEREKRIDLFDALSPLM